MRLSAFARQATEVWEVPRDVLLGRYPSFVTGGPLPKGHVPVFVFHSLEPESFGRKIEHLAENGYQTLSADEYVEVLTGQRPSPDKAVVLTFDDGRSSVFSVGLPLLRRFGMKGIVFLVPGRTGSVAQREAEAAFLTWEEVGGLVASGLFDVQSHTRLHARVHSRSRVEGFMTPEMKQGYAVMDVPLVREGARDLLADEIPLGTPLLASAPRTSEARRFHEDPEIRKPCVEAVAGSGGAAFFRERGWRRRLESLVPATVAGRLESPEEQRQAIQTELAEARRVIEEHTGRPVVHLCYPWHVSGPTARRIAREAGYRTAFCGKVAGVPITLPGGDLERVARIGEDYLELLPGRGRLSLAAVLRRKWLRRTKARP